ncbi:hypothetical protein [Kordiimonas pumila]|uniref:Uncharacterized protein n=1 Tax=Kordiimonas pumila TaxID=2161677 RepID=A0ABV7D4K3_9PROT|nr:hypothetical protein [Kordiimonas pumila]
MTDIYLPATPAPASVRITPRQRTKVSTASSGRILSRLYGGQSYSMTLVYNPMHKATAAPLLAFLQEMQGRHGIFRVDVPQLNGVGGLNVGSFVNFSDDTKLHMITGTGPLTYSPPQRGSGTVSATSPYMRCSFTSDTQEFSLAKNGLISLQLELVERV